jgi:hypothetical protein
MTRREMQFGFANALCSLHQLFGYDDPYFRFDNQMEKNKTK